MFYISLKYLIWKRIIVSLSWQYSIMNNCANIPPFALAMLSMYVHQSSLSCWKCSFWLKLLFEAMCISKAQFCFHIASKNMIRVRFFNQNWLDSRCIMCNSWTESMLADFSKFLAYVVLWSYEPYIDSTGLLPSLREFVLALTCKCSTALCKTNAFKQTLKVYVKYSVVMHNRNKYFKRWYNLLFVLDKIIILSNKCAAHSAFKFPEIILFLKFQFLYFPMNFLPLAGIDSNCAR